MGKKKLCEVCQLPLLKAEIKENRTEHYACRNVKYFKKKGGNTSTSRRKSALKTMIKKPNIFRKIFRNEDY